MGVIYNLIMPGSHTSGKHGLVCMVEGMMKCKQKEHKDVGRVVRVPAAGGG